MRIDQSRKPRLKLLGVAVALTAASAFAGEITLYEHRDFDGPSVTIHGAAPNLERTGFNDSASSLVVRDGVWQACTNAYFKGRCVQLQPGTYSDLRDTLNDRISSVREIAAASGAGAPVIVGTAPPPVVATEPRIVLYQHTGTSGSSVELTGTIRDLDRVAFEDRANAAIVYGGTWRLCSGSRGRGECFDFGPGRYENLGSLGGRVSSAELIAVGGPPVAAIPPVPPAARVVMYELPNFDGRQFVVEREAALANLDWMGFNDRAASMRIEAGYWTFCSGAGFQGDCRTFGPGDYARLPWALDRKISSARPANEVYGGTLTPYSYVR